METVAIIGQKGGTAKTTTVENLAVEAAAQGKTVVVIDLDPQVTVSKWGDRRTQRDPESENPIVLSAVPARLPQVLEAAQRNGATLVLIDTAGRSAEAAIAAARVAKLVLVPLRPEAKDVETLPAVRDLLIAAGNPPAVVTFTQCPIQGEYELEMGAVAERHGFPVCPAVLHMRRAYANASWPGQSAAEFEPKDKAGEEVRELYKFVIEQLNIKTAAE